MTNASPQPGTNGAGNNGTDRRQVILGFAQALSDVRQAAGQPSFRQMAQTSGCISHATLHEATRGKRLPTWEATEQFLIACGVDPHPWREQWRRANRLVSRPSTGQPAQPASRPAVPGTATGTASPTREPDRSQLAGPSWSPPGQEGDERVEQLRTEVPTTGPTRTMPVSVRTRHVARRWEKLGTLLAAIALIVGGYAAASWTQQSSSNTANATSPTVSRPSSTSSPSSVGSVPCPRPNESSVRSWKSSRIDGAAMEYRSGRLSLCGKVAAGETTKQGFTLKNTGTTKISGWTVHMVKSTGTCLTDADRTGRIADLDPGETFSASIAFEAPDRAGGCSAEFEIRDASGKPVFDEGFTVPFAVVVA